MEVGALTQAWQNHKENTLGRDFSLLVGEAVGQEGPAGISRECVSSLLLEGWSLLLLLMGGLALEGTKGEHTFQCCRLQC